MVTSTKGGHGVNVVKLWKVLALRRDKCAKVDSNIFFKIYITVSRNYPCKKNKTTELKSKWRKE